MIDFTKPVQTRSGADVTIITVIGRGRYPVVGYIGTEDTPATWTISGKFQSDQAEHGNDLMNVPEKRYVWLNVYNDRKDTFSVVAHGSRAEADRNGRADAGDGIEKRFACMKIEVKPGQFDD